METNNEVRIQPEQIEADSNLLKGLSGSLKDWTAELEMIEKELIDQALIDAKAGQGKSNRYLALEKRERDLTANIKEANEKAGNVAKRYANPALAELVNQSLKLISHE